MENLDQSNNKNVSLSLIAEYGASDSDSDDTETRSNNTGNEDSDAAELSEMVLKNNIINACAHGPLSRGSGLDGETTRHMIIDSAESGVVEYDVTEYRDDDSDSDSSSSDSSDSDVDSVKDIDESSGDDESAKAEKVEVPKVQGELGLEDLPPIEDLAISLPEQECTKIGTIASVVDRLVIVRAFPQTPAVDLDSVLFLDSGAKALGKVFDVFGPVTEPHYCVRFNSAEHVRERGAAPGVDVYIAPRTPHTNYVLLAQLMKIKGSDASWLNDVEPPPQHVEYSDDEEERRANRARRDANRQRGEESDGETSRRQEKRQPERNRQRPSESSSRFGSGPSRGRNPFYAGTRRNNPGVFRPARPWGNFSMRAGVDDSGGGGGWGVPWGAAWAPRWAPPSPHGPPPPRPPPPHPSYFAPWPGAAPPPPPPT